MNGWEAGILQYFESIRSPLLNQIFEYITMLGEETLIIVLVAAMYFAVDRQMARKFFYISVTSMGFNGIIKNFVKRSRPFAMGVTTCVRPSTATGYSFPSGHTQNFSTWSTALAVHFKKKGLYIFAFTGILFVAISRMYLGAHYPTDVLCGGVLGIGCAYLGSRLWNKVKDPIHLFLGTLLLLTPFVFVFMYKPDPLYEDFYKLYGMFLGLIGSTWFDKRYVTFSYNVSIQKKILRVIGAVALALIVKLSTHSICEFDVLQLTYFAQILRHFALVMVVFGIYPLAM